METHASSASEFIQTPSHGSQFIPIHHSPSPLPTDNLSTQHPIHVDPDFQHEHQLTVVLPIPMNVYPMQTRSKNGIIRRKAFFALIGSSKLPISEPKTFKATSKVPKWQDAMKNEIDALHSQNTWSLATLPVDKNLVGCKWVHRVSKNVDGFVVRYKVRLVAKVMPKNKV